jgi:hypothetical protein
VRQGLAPCGPAQSVKSEPGASPPAGGCEQFDLARLAFYLAALRIQKTTEASNAALTALIPSIYEIGIWRVSNNWPAKSLAQAEAKNMVRRLAL